MELKEAAGQIIIAGYEGSKPSIPLEGAIKTGKIGGVIFFARNLQSLSQIAETNQRLAQLSRPEFPLILSIDQEGGRVQRIKDDLGATRLPPALATTATSPQVGYELGQIMAKELKSLGFNLNFAPVLDIHSNPQNPIIGDRAYGCTKEEVSRFALPVIKAHLDNLLMCCAKHFPGHGDTDTDSHLDLPTLPHTLGQLSDRELAPFADAIKIDVPMIMTAHILLPEIDRIHPATLSPRIINGILRRDMAFEGVIVSDDLEMAAIADNYSILKAAILALRAGVDAFIISKTQELWFPLRDQLVNAAESDTEIRDAIHQAAERVVHTKRKFISSPETLNWSECVGKQEHLDFVRKHFNI